MMKKKIVSLLLLFIIVFGSQVSAQTAILEPCTVYYNEPICICDEQMALDAAVAAEIDAARGEGYSANKRNALELLMLLHDGFATRRDGTVMYPDFYAGTYIDDSGSLVLLIAASHQRSALEHEGGALLIEAGVSYRFVEFSYAELLATSERIMDIRLERAVLSDDICVYASNVTGTGIRTDLNMITVFLLEYNDDMIAGFKRYVYDSPMLMFRQLDFVLDLSGGQHSFRT